MSIANDITDIADRIDQEWMRIYHNTNADSTDLDGLDALADELREIAEKLRH